MTTTTFLTFVVDQCGKAEEAINFYTSIFPNSEIKSIKNTRKEMQEVHRSLLNMVYLH